MGFCQMMTTQMGILFEGKTIVEFLAKVFCRGNHLKCEFAWDIPAKTTPAIETPNVSPFVWYGFTNLSWCMSVLRCEYLHKLHKPLKIRTGSLAQYLSILMRVQGDDDVKMRSVACKSGL